MELSYRVRAAVAASAVLGAAATLLAVRAGEHLLVLPTLAVLAGVGVLCRVVSVRLTEAGALSSVHYLPVLAAAVVSGPGGAALVAVASEGLGLAVRRRPFPKIVFNLGQQVLAAVVAGVVFGAAGGAFLAAGSPAAGVGLADQILPFLAASLAYFLVNRTLVTAVVAAEAGEPFRAIWRRLDGGMLPMDLALSLLALLVAHLHPAWGAPGQLVLVLPVLGTRLGYVAEGKSRRAGRDLLKLMVKSLEAQDPYTSGHSVRVAEASKRLARALGLDADRTESVETAALLHDIGKIGIEYAEILTQEGELTDEQYAVMQEHPRRGVEILRGVESLGGGVLEIVLHHHERWDGEGYPAGLAGEEIPLGARIVGLCDAIDAMGSRRSYRPALSAEAIRAELRRCAGEQFDPRAVEAALDLDLPGELSQGEARVTPEDAEAATPRSKAGRGAA